MKPWATVLTPTMVVLHEPGKPDRVVPVQEALATMNDSLPREPDEWVWLEDDWREVFRGGGCE